MMHKTEQEMNDPKFNEWWAHHPWRVVECNGQKVWHMNMLYIISGFLLGLTVSSVFALTDAIKYTEYKREKQTLNIPDEHIAQKYNQRQIARYEKFMKFGQKMKQR